MRKRKLARLASMHAAPNCGDGSSSKRSNNSSSGHRMRSAKESPAQERDIQVQAGGGSEAEDGSRI